jgi:hypothetical protein
MEGGAVVRRVDENEPTNEDGRRPGDDRAGKTEMDRPQLSLPYMFITRLFVVFLPAANALRRPREAQNLR